MDENIRDLIDWNSQEMSPHIRAKLETAFNDPKRAAAGKTIIDKKPGVYDAGAEPEGVIQNPNDFHKNYHASTVILVKEIGNFLVKEYPGWAWVIQVAESGHMIYILNHHLHPSMGARIRMEDVMYDPTYKVAKNQAGEILERFGMLRRGLHGENLSRLMRAPRDAAKNCVPFIDDLPDKKAAFNAEISRALHSGEMEIVDVGGYKYLVDKRGKK